MQEFPLDEHVDVRSGPTSNVCDLPSRGSIPVEVVDGLPTPILVSRISDDRVVRLNPEFTAAYGHSTESASGLSAEDLHYVGGDRWTTLDHHERGNLRSVDVRIRSADGECRWAQADVSRFDMDGQDVLLTTLHDIGDRKQAEARVAEMALFPDMNPGPVVRLDLTGTVHRSNEAARTVFGDDLEGRCLWDLCPSISEEVRARVLAGNETVREDAPVGDRWLRFTFARPPDAAQIFVFGSDVTKEKTAEQELAERARFPAMNPGPVARLDAAGTVLRANPAAAALFGFETLRGRSWLELCPDIDGPLWQRILQEDAPVRTEAEVGDRWFSFTLRHEPVANQVFVYGSDMSELKEAQRALAELARFPDMNPGPVCRLDRSGIVLLANPAARRLFEADDLAGRAWQELVPEVDAKRWAGILASDEPTVVEARIGPCDLVLTHAPGPEGLFVFVYGSDVTREKEAERILRQREKMATLGTLSAGVAHELNNPAAAAQRAAEQLERAISGLHAAQAALGASGLSPEVWGIFPELTQRAREAANNLSDLEGMVHAEAEDALEEWLDRHGFEAPWETAAVLAEAGQSVEDLDALHGLVGAASLQDVVEWQACSFRVYRLLDEIRSGSWRISEIVGAMKAYSYLGQAPVQSVDVNDGIRNTLVILRSKLKQGVTVVPALSDGLPRIEAFGSELNQVWTNIIDNAVQAMEGRGTLRLTSAPGRECVVVEIEDDGPGIPPEHQAQVFDAFFTTKPPGEGTGLGLHTTYNIVVEKHGGSIRVESKPGSTRFRVELPLHPKRA